jgi:hypothetical protein
MKHAVLCAVWLGNCATVGHTCFDSNGNGLRSVARNIATFYAQKKKLLVYDCHNGVCPSSGAVVCKPLLHTWGPV